MQTIHVSKTKEFSQEKKNKDIMKKEMEIKMPFILIIQVNITNEAQEYLPPVKTHLPSFQAICFQKLSGCQKFYGDFVQPEVPYQDHVTGGDVHVGLDGFLTPG